MFARTVGAAAWAEFGSGAAVGRFSAVAGEGEERPDGVTAPYQLDGGQVTSAVRLNASAGRLRRTGGAAGRFHTRLRDMERDLASRAGGPDHSRARSLAGQGRPPVVGEQRTFKVCETPTCETFVDATAVARVQRDAAHGVVDTVAAMIR